MKTRLQAPDFIKGIAIILMVYGHLTMVGTWADAQNVATSWIYTFHMPLFLMVSGMFFSAENNLAEKTRRILLRIGVPYVVFVSLYLLGLAVIERIGISTSNTPPESFAQFVLSVFLYPYGGYWFLHALLLIQLSLLMGHRAAALFNGSSSVIGWLISAILLYVLVACGIFQARTVVFFLLGMMIRSLAGLTPELPVLLGWGAAALVWTVDYVLQLEALPEFGFAQVIWCISLFAGLYTLGQYFGSARIPNLISWVGRNSLSILVFHAIFVVLLKPFAALSLKVDPTGLAYALLTTGIVMALCLLSAFICDKIRISRFLFASEQCYIPFRQDPKGNEPGK